MIWKNKKAAGSTGIIWQIIVLLIIVVLVVFMVLYFVSNQANSISSREQNLAKQLGLLISAASPVTEFEIPETPDYAVQEIWKQENPNARGVELCVKLKKDSNGYCQRVFLVNDFEVVKKENKIVVRVIENGN